MILTYEQWSITNVLVLPPAHEVEEFESIHGCNLANEMTRLHFNKYEEYRNNMVLTYEEWIVQNPHQLVDDEWQTANEKQQDFFAFHGLNLNEEIEKLRKQEYELYLQRHNAGVIE